MSIYEKDMSTGFTMLELVVYVSLFSVLSLLIFNVLNQAQINVFLHAKHNEKTIRDVLVCDLLRRDLMCADAQCSYWDEDNFVFKKQGVSIGWVCEKTGVFRLCGDYDFKNKTWQKNKKRLVKSRVNWKMDAYKLALHLHDDKQLVRGVSVMCGKKLILQVRLRNGVLI
jgi:type II secretory pathway component PulJ